MKTILLKFSGPLQSWGTSSLFETRYTDRYPSKSAVIGIIAASLGYRRDDDDLITALNKLEFAVRIDQVGRILRDFQIATKYKKNAVEDRKYVTNRYYLQDAVFIVGIGSDDEYLINLIELALNKPYFQPFLGRRSLPLNVDFFLGTTDKNVIESLTSEDWHAAEWYKKKMYRNNSTEKYVGLEIYADAPLIQNSISFVTKDMVKSFSQKKRQHDFRSIATLIVQKQFDNIEEHDAFAGIGGSNVFI